MTVLGDSGNETHVSIEALFENVENVLPQNATISFDWSISKQEYWHVLKGGLMFARLKKFGR